MRKQIGLGCKLSMTPSTSSSSYTEIGGLLSFPGPNASADDVDTTTLDNSTSVTSGAWKTFQRGQVDPGEMTVTMAYGSTDSASKKLGTALKDGVIRKWKVSYLSTAVTAEVFTGYVKGLGREIGGANAMIQRNVTIKATGNPGFPST